ncbi:MAG: type II toxin-antitoxin system RelE/ParE family toxin [Patescibacteria group bacterium]
MWLRAEIKTPPFSREARIEAGALLRQVQLGHTLTMPHSRPMPSVGIRCHELRIPEKDMSWRIIYRTDPDAIVIVDVFPKRTRATPHHILQRARRRLAAYDSTGKIE